MERVTYSVKILSTSKKYYSTVTVSADIVKKSSFLEQLVKKYNKIELAYHEPKVLDYFFTHYIEIFSSDEICYTFTDLLKLYTVTKYLQILEYEEILLRNILDEIFSGNHTSTQLRSYLEEYPELLHHKVLFINNTANINNIASESSIGLSYNGDFISTLTKYSRASTGVDNMMLSLYHKNKHHVVNVKDGNLLEPRNIDRFIITDDGIIYIITKDLQFINIETGENLKKSIPGIFYINADGGHTIITKLINQPNIMLIIIYDKDNTPLLLKEFDTKSDALMKPSMSGDNICEIYNNNVTEITKVAGDISYKIPDDIIIKADGPSSSDDRYFKISNYKDKYVVYDILEDKKLTLHDNHHAELYLSDDGYFEIIDDTVIYRTYQHKEILETTLYYKSVIPLKAVNNNTIYIQGIDKNKEQIFSVRANMLNEIL